MWRKRSPSSVQTYVSTATRRFHTNRPGQKPQFSFSSTFVSAIADLPESLCKHGKDYSSGMMTISICLISSEQGRRLTIYEQHAGWRLVKDGFNLTTPDDRHKHRTVPVLCPTRQHPLTAAQYSMHLIMGRERAASWPNEPMKLSKNLQEVLKSGALELKAGWHFKSAGQLRWGTWHRLQR